MVEPERATRLRASDIERESVASALREHMVAGRLSMEEFSSRIGRTYEATVIAELDDVVRDLPLGAGHVTTPRRPRVKLRSAHLVAGFWRSAAACASGLGKVAESSKRAYGALASWRWVLLTVPVGLTTWLAFLVAGRRAKRPDLLLASALYGAGLVAQIALSGHHLRSAGGEVGALVWLVGMVHAIAVRKSVARSFSRISPAAGS